MGVAAKMAGEDIQDAANGVEMRSLSKYPLMGKLQKHQKVNLTVIAGKTATREMIRTAPKRANDGGLVAPT